MNSTNKNTITYTTAKKVNDTEKNQMILIVNRIAELIKEKHT